MQRKRFLLLLILVLILLGGTWWLQRMQRHPETPQSPATHVVPPEGAVSAPEVVPAPTGAEKRREVRRPGGHRIAIIIDDLGYNGRNYRPFVEMRYPLSFAVLPSLPYSQRIAREAVGRGKEVLLHLPLEPHGYPEKNPGEGVILSGMNEGEMRKILLEDLKSVPGAVGVNNHMGSRLMEEEETMRALLSELKRRDLYFVDSLTTNHTVAPSLAKELGVRVGTRGVFLDNYQERSYIEGQLRTLSQMAQRNGSAIGVGHPYAITASVLKDYLPRLEREGVQVVRASKLVR